MSDLLRDLVTSENCDTSNGNPLSQLLKNFVETSRTQNFVNEIKLDSSIKLSSEEKRKIKTRSEVMARQFFPDKNEDFIEDQMRSFFKQLSINEKETNEFFGSTERGKFSSPFNVDKEFDLNFDEKFEEEFGNLNQLELLNRMGYEEYAHLMRESMNIEYMNEHGPTYKFTEGENRYLNNPHAFDIGMKLCKNGDLFEAVKAFESEVKQNPNNSQAWRMLGQCHAECDDDVAAIAALSTAVKVDPHNLEALLDLGVSYTNELNKFRALTYLRNWLEHHPLYATLMKEAGNLDKSTLNYSKYHEKITNLFLKASKMNPNDADVFSVLGVLYNLSDEYDKAIEAFKRAIQLNPNNHTLWNKLGATQANSQRSNLAIDAYRNALKIKPNYVRAWVNLGIAYANQKRNEEAARYYLRALRMCPNSEHVWQYLGMAFYSMKRNDLVEKCKFKDIKLFANEFKF